MFCHKYREPVFITKNGEGDLAVMSIETYEELVGKSELYRLIQEGIDDIKKGKTKTEQEVLKNMELALEK
jgi:prevent-host-death family protein